MLESILDVLQLIVGGLLGSIVGILFSRSSQFKIIIYDVLIGMVCAVYLTNPLAYVIDKLIIHIEGMPAGSTAFLIGLLGVPILRSLFYYVDDDKAISKILRRILPYMDSKDKDDDDTDINGSSE